MGNTGEKTMNREMDMEGSDGKLYGLDDMVKAEGDHGARLPCLLYRDGDLRGSRSF